MRTDYQHVVIGRTSQLVAVVTANGRAHRGQSARLRGPDGAAMLPADTVERPDHRLQRGLASQLAIAYGAVLTTSTSTPAVRACTNTCRTATPRG